MKILTLRNKVKESLFAVNNAVIEFESLVKISNSNKELLSYGRMDSFNEFNTSVANVVDSQKKLTDAKSKVLVDSTNYDRELRKVIKNAKNCLFVTVLCCAVIFLNNS